MARKTIVAGNWKMNKTASEAKALIEALKPKLAGLSAVEAIVCPPFTSLAAAVSAVSGSNIRVGAQNVHWETTGAFTGEVSAAMLKEIGVEYVIIGHSERRQYFGETDETVNKRLKAALAGGLKPIVCVGETLEEREGNKTQSVLERQIHVGFAGLNAEQMRGMIIAYEPVWAIGTGKTATPAMAQDAHAFIRSRIATEFDSATAESVRIQYGGSMKPDNARELVASPDIDGGLIGGASLTAEAFSELIRNCVS